MPACAACGAILTIAIPSPPVMIAPIIAQIFLAISYNSPQFSITPACAACGTALKSATPSPPPIRAPITARIFFRISTITYHMVY